MKNDMIGVWGHKSHWTHLQLTLYDRYKQIDYRCNRSNYKDYSTYGGSGIKCDFSSLSEFVDAVKAQVHGSGTLQDGTVVEFYSWDEFKSDPSKYQIDKDIRCGHGSDYNSSTIAIVDKSVNNREHVMRQSNLTSHFGNKNWATHKTKKPVVIEYTNGDVVEYDSLDTVASLRNRTASCIGMYISGKIGLPDDITAIYFGKRR